MKRPEYCPAYTSLLVTLETRFSACCVHRELQEPLSKSPSWKNPLWNDGVGEGVGVENVADEKVGASDAVGRIEDVVSSADDVSTAVEDSGTQVEVATAVESTDETETGAYCELTTVVVVVSVSVFVAVAVTRDETLDTAGGAGGSKWVLSMIVPSQSSTKQLMSKISKTHNGGGVYETFRMIVSVKK